MQKNSNLEDFNAAASFVIRKLRLPFNGHRWGFQKVLVLRLQWIWKGYVEGRWSFPYGTAGHQGIQIPRALCLDVLSDIIAKEEIFNRPSGAFAFFNGYFISCSSVVH